MNDLTRILHAMETRAPQVAVRDPMAFLSPGSELRPRWDAERAVNEGYLKQTYVFVGVNKTADAIARHPFRAGRNPEDPSRYSNGHPLAQLLGPGLPGPNPSWSPKQFWKYTAAQYILTGKFAWLIEREGRNGRIVGLWPLQAQHLIPVEGRGGSYFSGFRYGASQKIYSTDQIIYCWDRSQGNYREPQSWLEASALDISIAQMVDQYDFALLKNNAIPSTIIATEPFAEDGMRKAFRAQFLAQFGGAGNSGKTMFLEADPDVGPDGSTSNNIKGKISVERLGMSPQELMSAEKRAAIHLDISVALRMPMSVLGDSTYAKDSNMEMDKLNWYTDTVVPLAEDLADQVNTELVPKLDISRKIYGWFDFSKNTILQPKPRYSAPEYVALVDKKIMERDEARAEMGLPPWDSIQHPEPDEEQPEVIEGEVVEEKTLNGGTPRLGTLAGRPRELPPAAIQRVLRNQKTALAQRVNGRRARKAESLADLYDVDFWQAEMTREFGAKEAKRLAQIAVRELRAATSVEEAFQRVEREVRGTEPISLDVVAVVIDAIKREKIEPSKAVEYLWT